MIDKRKTMKDLPVSERPYEKCISFGPEVLSDAELLAVIMRNGKQGVSSRQLAETVLKRLMPLGGLPALKNISVGELTEMPGIGPVKAVMLQCIGELGVRISRAEMHASVRLTSPDSIAAFFMEEMRSLDHEVVKAAYFDNKGGFIASRDLSSGTVARSVLSPREFFIEALKHRAVYTVVLHNHPSGDPTPSAEDLQLTLQLVRAGRLLQIPVYDHIIIGDHCYTSFQECGYMNDDCAF